MGRYATLVLAALCGLSLATALVAAPTVPAEAPQVSTRLERVALFKNGLGYFVRRGELPASPTSVLLGPFAAPMHGTFWVSTPATAGLESVIVRETGVKGEEVDARSIPEPAESQCRAHGNGLDRRRRQGRDHRHPPLLCPGPAPHYPSQAPLSDGTGAQ